MGATRNPVRGCTQVSPGCAHCYAKTFGERFRGVPGHPFEQGFALYFQAQVHTASLLKLVAMCSAARQDSASIVSVGL
jgi:protein gp37